MSGMGTDYENCLEGKLVGKRPKVPFFSTATGEIITEEGKLGPDYWGTNAENPVLFLDAVKKLIETVADDILFVEVGPHTQLMGPLRQIFKVAAKTGDLSYVSCLERYKDCTSCILNMAGQLFQHDVAVNFSKINSGGKVLTDLPRYAWQHNATHWHESRVSREW